MTKDEFHNWCDRHAVNIIDNNKRAHKYTKQNVKYFTSSLNYNYVSTEDIVMETEPLYTIEISQSELEKIAEFELQVFNNLKEHGHFNMFEIMAEQKRRENNLKSKYEAVRKAYEHYSMMLKLAESGEL